MKGTEGTPKKRMLGQTFPRSRSFPSSPLTSLLKHLSSPSDSFLCRCVKELLKCHELSGLLIFPVFSLKRVKGEQNLFKTKNSHSCHQERKTILLLLLFFLATFTREPIRVIQFAVALFLLTVSFTFQRINVSTDCFCLCSAEISSSSL